MKQLCDYLVLLSPLIARTSLNVVHINYGLQWNCRVLSLMWNTCTIQREEEEGNHLNIYHNVTRIKDVIFSLLFTVEIMYIMEFIVHNSWAFIGQFQYASEYIIELLD